MTDTTWDPSKPILEIENLSISFFTRLREIPAVMDFSCTVMAGESMGLVGECGCGKSTVALAVMRDLGKNGRIVGGSIKFKGRDLTHMNDEELRHIRGSEIAMIYQEPMASLNPAMKIGAQLAEVPMIHQGMSKGRGVEAGPSDRGRRAPARPRPHAAILSAPAVGWPATAHRHRHGADEQTRAADPR